MKNFLLVCLLGLGGCSLLPQNQTDNTGAVIALSVIQIATSLATQGCVATAIPDPVVACTLPPNATSAQANAVLQQCFAASLIGVVVARHQALVCPPPPAPVPVPVPAPPPVALPPPAKP